MGKIKLITSLNIIVVAAIAAAAPPMVKAGSCCSGDAQNTVMSAEKPVASNPLSLKEVYSERLPMLSRFIANAVKALEAGDKKTALANLNKAKQMMTRLNEAIGKLVEPEFANVRCPVTGSPINPDKVDKAFVRNYKGRRIALCCEDCPAIWDKLTDAEKDAKLAKVLRVVAPPGQKCLR